MKTVGLEVIYRQNSVRFFLSLYMASAYDEVALTKEIQENIAPGKLNDSKKKPPIHYQELKPSKQQKNRAKIRNIQTTTLNTEKKNNAKKLTPCNSSRPPTQ